MRTWYAVLVVHLCAHHSSTNSPTESNGAAFTCPRSSIRRQQGEVLFSEEERIFEEKGFTKKYAEEFYRSMLKQCPCVFIEKDNVVLSSGPPQRQNSFKATKKETAASVRSEFLVAATSITPTIKLGRQTPEKVIRSCEEMLFIFFTFSGAKVEREVEESVHCDGAIFL